MRVYVHVFVRLCTYVRVHMRGIAFAPHMCALANLWMYVCVCGIIYRFSRTNLFPFLNVSSLLYNVPNWMVHVLCANKCYISNETKRFSFYVNSMWPSDAIWRQRSGSTLAQVMTCCLTAPSHYLNQCWLIISKVQWHSSEGNFVGYTSTTIH